MCIYIQQMPLCGHAPPTLLSYTTCTAVLAQLMRIAEPAAWATPAARAAVPFDLPADCDPRPGNIWTIYADDYCGWECRNNAFVVRRSAPGLGGGEGALLPSGEGLGYGYGYGGGGGDGADGGDGGGDGGMGLLPAYVPGNEAGQCASLGNDDGWLGGEGMHHGKAAYVLGMPDARYGPGSERLGIGWRST